jgi:hypothetical protein
VIDEPTRARLVAVADLIAPAGDDLPAASAIDTCGKWLDRILVADPSFATPVARLADCTSWQDLEALHRDDPATFETATFAVLAAYYLHPRVRRRMGYPGQGPSPILEGEPEEYLPLDLLQRVRDRGPIYVATPGG